MTAHSKPDPTPPDIMISPGFAQWLKDRKVSLGFTARQANKFFMAGVNPENNLSLFERTFDQASGIAVSGNSIFLSTLYQIWHLHNSLPAGESQQGYDRVYLPQSAYTTGDCAVHEMALNANGQLIFVNARFSCLSALSPTHSFKPLWKPSFITDLVPEDRCHLNGMAMTDSGQVKYVTVCATTNSKEGWRKHRANGGCLIDVEKNEIVHSGLSMPHSPRIYNDRVWLLNSGHGELGFIDFKTKTFQPVVVCPGFLRGLVFIDHYAIVTTSKPRKGADKAFSGLPMETMVASGSIVPECAILVIDLNEKKIVHQLKIEGLVEELMDVTVIPDCVRPMMMGIKTGEIKNIFSIEPIQKNDTRKTQLNPILV